MSSANSAQKQAVETAESAPAKPAAPRPEASKPRWPRVNASIDTALRVLSLVGLGFLKPIVSMARGEDPRAHMRQLWLDLGAPLLASAGISYFGNTPTVVSYTSIVAAFAFSAFVGVFFGYYPARKAAFLDPIEALRYE